MAQHHSTSPQNIYNVPSEMDQHTSAAAEETVRESDAKIMRKIRRITDHGNNAEVKRRKDGSLTVYEVKKNIVE